MLSTRLVTNLDGFRALATVWNCLLQRTRTDNLFLTWEWLYVWAKTYLGTDELWIILVYERDRDLVGIAPLFIKRVKAFGVANRRDLRFLGTEEVSSSYLDFIVLEKKKQAVLRHIYDFIHNEASSAWDTLTLSEIPAESSTVDLWWGFADQDGKVLDLVGTTGCPIIELTGRLEDFLRNIGGGARYDLQRKRKRLEREGCPVYDRAVSVQEVEKKLDSFIQLHELRWKDKAGGGVFQKTRFARFHREVARRLSENGWVRLDFLLLDGEPVAGVYGFTYKGRYYYYLPGLNPRAVPGASVGRLLLYHCVERAIAEGCGECDLLRGAAQYKVAWATRIRRSLTIRHYNRHVRAGLTRFFESAKSTLKVLVR